MKRFATLTVALTIALLLPFSIPAQTDEPTMAEPVITGTKPVDTVADQVAPEDPEPIDQSALSVQTETVQVEQVNITGVTGFKKESRKFIKALNEGGLDNVVSYLHPQGFLSKKVKAKKPDYPLSNHLYKRVVFVKFIESEASSTDSVITFYHGAFLNLGGREKYVELVALPPEDVPEQADTLKWKLSTLGINWVKTGDIWSIAQIDFMQPLPSNTQVPKSIDPSAQTVEPTTPEPIDQSALSVQTETVQVEQVNITGVTGFEQESQKFIKALNEGGLGNTISYLHPQGNLLRIIKTSESNPYYHLRNHWFKCLTFDKFIKSEARAENFVVTSHSGSYLSIGDKKRAELEALEKEEALKQMDTLTPLPITVAIVWVKTKDKWSVVNIEFQAPQKPQPEKAKKE